MREVDARLALIRNAVAAEYEPPKVSPLARRTSVYGRMVAAVEAECPVTEECRESYDYDFAERVGIKIDSGFRELCGSKSALPDCCAYHSSLLEMGSVEFWNLAQQRPFVPGMVRVPTPRPEPVYCSRCESVGHVVASCPFSVGDADLRESARLRRERRVSTGIAA